jgi:hypothetical protein
MGSLSSKHVRVAAGMGLALVLSGCPYESKEPIAPVESAVLDASLNGRWRCLSSASESNEGKTTTVTFWPFDRHQYAVSVDMPDEGLVLFRAHAVKVSAAQFLNFQALTGEEDGGWSLLRYTLVDGDLLRLRFVSDKLLSKDNTVSEVRALIEKNLEAPELYEPGYVCVRLPKK